MTKPGTTFQKIYALVSQVPFGKVTTYGQVARRLGINNPKVVGYALHSESMQDSVPWHRIINSKGTISKRATDSEELQKKLEFHIVKGIYDSESLNTDKKLSTLNGKIISIINGNLLSSEDNSTSRIISTNKSANNGIIHIIDNVLSEINNQESFGGSKPNIKTKFNSDIYNNKNY